MSRRLRLAHPGGRSPSGAAPGPKASGSVAGSGRPVLGYRPAAEPGPSRAASLPGGKCRFDGVPPSFEAVPQASRLPRLRRARPPQATGACAGRRCTRLPPRTRFSAKARDQGQDPGSRSQGAQPSKHRLLVRSTTKVCGTTSPVLVKAPLPGTVTVSQCRARLGFRQTLSARLAEPGGWWPCPGWGGIDSDPHICQEAVVSARGNSFPGRDWNQRAVHNPQPMTRNANCLLVGLTATEDTRSSCGSRHGPAAKTRRSALTSPNEPWKLSQPRAR